VVGGGEAVLKLFDAKILFATRFNRERPLPFKGRDRVGMGVVTRGNLCERSSHLLCRGLPGGKSLFCFAKKVTKKGEPAALLFIFWVCCRRYFC
jgi:hypothetical protein